LTIKEKLDIIKCNIKNSAEKSGRNYEDIRLLAVTKTMPTEPIKMAIDCGVNCIGENYVQEFLEKYDFYKENNIDCHFIGHLQSNKVKYISEKVNLIHSVDSLSLIKEIDKQSKKIGKIQNVLIEVNLTKEDSKFGVYEENLLELLEKASEFSNILVNGLMTMPPIHYNDDQLRGVFSKLNRIFCYLKEIKIAKNVSMKHLSMGMSKDYQIAILEGSNLVRLGSVIFGVRN
jgi:pyridoxal phosphate enzyme (YggS family)